MKVTDDTRYVTSEEMAVRLRVSLRTLQKMIKEGTAPEHIRVGHRLLFVVAKSPENVAA